MKATRKTSVKQTRTTYSSGLDWPHDRQQIQMKPIPDQRKNNIGPKVDITDGNRKGF